MKKTKKKPKKTQKNQKKPKNPRIVAQLTVTRCIREKRDTI